MLKKTNVNSEIVFKYSQLENHKILAQLTPPKKIPRLFSEFHKSLQILISEERKRYLYYAIERYRCHTQIITEHEQANRNLHSSDSAISSFEKNYSDKDTPNEVKNVVTINLTKTTEIINTSNELTYLKEKTRKVLEQTKEEYSLIKYAEYASFLEKEETWQQFIQTQQDAKKKQMLQQLYFEWKKHSAYAHYPSLLLLQSIENLLFIQKEIKTIIKKMSWFQKRQFQEYYNYLQQFNRAINNEKDKIHHSISARFEKIQTTYDLSQDDVLFPVIFELKKQGVLKKQTPLDFKREEKELSCQTIIEFHRHLCYPDPCEFSLNSKSYYNKTTHSKKTLKIVSIKQKDNTLLVPLLLSEEIPKNKKKPKWLFIGNNLRFCFFNDKNRKNLMIRLNLLSFFVNFKSINDSNIESDEKLNFLFLLENDIINEINNVKKNHYNKLTLIQKKSSFFLKKWVIFNEKYLKEIIKLQIFHIEYLIEKIKYKKNIKEDINKNMNLNKIKNIIKNIEIKIENNKNLFKNKNEIKEKLFKINKELEKITKKIKTIKDSSNEIELLFIILRQENIEDESIKKQKIFTEKSVIFFNNSTIKEKKFFIEHHKNDFILGEKTIINIIENEDVNIFNKQKNYIQNIIFILNFSMLNPCFNYNLFNDLINKLFKKYKRFIKENQRLLHIENLFCESSKELSHRITAINFAESKKELLKKNKSNNENEKLEKKENQKIESKNMTLYFSSQEKKHKEDEDYKKTKLEKSCFFNVN